MLANRAALLPGTIATYHVGIAMIALTLRMHARPVHGCIRGLVLAAIAGLLPVARAQEPTPAQLADAVWIEGRVKIPAGTPKDERPEVIADAIGIVTFDKHRVRAAADGTFRVAFAKDCRAGQLRFDGRFLYLEKNFAWHAGDPTSGIVLEPRLGGVLHVRIDARAGVKAPGDRAPSLVKLLGLSKNGGPMPPVLSAQFGPDVVLGPVRPDCVYHVEIAAPPFVPLTSSDVEVAPGATSALDLVLRLGASVRGRVLGEDGQPVAGAAIGAYSEGLDVFGPEMYGLQKKTGSDGAFEVGGVPPGSLRLWATKVGLLTVDREITGIVEGERRSDVDLLLRTGNVIEGRVTDPDGAPAAGASVTARLSALEPADEVPPIVLSCGQDGSFRITGLLESPLDLRVRFEREPGQREPGQRDAAKRKRSFVARVDHVKPGTRDLVIVLEPLSLVEVRAVDDLGRPLARFTLGATRPKGPHVATAPDEHIEREVASTDGTFALEGLGNGAWDVYVYAKGVAYEPAQRIEVPKVAAPLVFTLKRDAVVAGSVRDAAGAPVVGAVVTVHWQRPAILGGVETGEQASVKSGKDGYFELAEVYPGHVKVSAKTTDGAVSTAIELALAPGERHAAVEVVVRKP